MKVNGVKIKSVNPEITINNVKKILNKLKIEVEEKYEFNNCGCYSVYLEVKNCEIIYSNGKGISQLLAKASAYVELIERVENLWFVYKYKQLNSNIYSKFKSAYFEELSSDFYKNIFKYFPKELYLNKKIYLVPFTEITESKITFLPIDYIFHLSSANGMCSGNTKEEALIQGICEIIERYCLIQFFYGNIHFSYIPESIISSEFSMPIYYALKSYGFTVKILELSNKGLYPAIAVLIIKNGKGLISAGSSLNIKLAIERCFTELMQGIKSFEMLETKLKILDEKYNNCSNFFYRNLLKSISNKNGFSINNLKKVGDFDIKYINNFKLKDLTSTNSLNFLINLIYNTNKKIFIKHSKGLSFNSYHIYIPSMSEILPETIEFSFSSFALILKEKMYFIAETTDSSKINKETVFCLYEDYINWFNDKMNSIINGSELLRCEYINYNIFLDNFDIASFWALLFLKIGEPLMSIKVLKKYSLSERKYDNFSLFRYSTNRSIIKSYILDSEKSKDKYMKINNFIQGKINLNEYFNFLIPSKCSKCFNKDLYCYKNNLKDFFSKLSCTI